MPEIRDTYLLDINRALRDVEELEQGFREAAQSAGKVTVDSQSLQQAERASRELSVELSRAAVEAAEAGTDARLIASALDLGRREAIGFEAAMERVAREADRAGDEIKRLPDDIRRADRETDRLRGSFGALKGAIIGAVAAFGIRGLLRQASEAVDSFNALNESVNAINVTFGKGAEIIFAYGEQSARSAGLARSAFQQAVVPIGALLQNFGFDQEEAASAAVRLTQRAADLASVFNTDVNDALLAVGSALRGETEPIRRYGVDVSQAAVASQALASGLVESTGELEGQTLAVARLNEILRQTERVAGDFAATSGEAANAARIVAAQAEEARAKFGEGLIPAWQELLTIAPDVLNAFVNLAPVVGDVAVGVAELIRSLDGAEEGGGRLARSVQLTTLALGELFDMAGANRDILSFLVAIFARDVEGAQVAVEALGDRIDQTFERAAAFQLISDLRDGADEADAFRQSLVNLSNAPGPEALEAGFQRMVRTAGVSSTQVLVELRRLIDEAVRFGLSAADVAVLEQRYLELSIAVSLGGIEARRFGEIQSKALEEARFASFESEHAALSQADAFRILTGAAEDAGVSISDLNVKDFPDLAIALAAVEPSTLGLATASENIKAFAEGFRASNASLSTEIDVFSGLPNKLRLSKDKFLANLEVTAEEQARFETNLLKLFQIAPALARTLEAQGLPARGLVEDFLKDTFSAERAESVLTGQAADLTGQFIGEINQSVRSAAGSPEQLSAMATFMEGFASPAVIATGVDAMVAELARALAAIEFRVPVNLIPFIPGAGFGAFGEVGLPPQLGGGAFGEVTINQTVNTTESKETTDAARGAEIAGATALNLARVR